MRLFQKRLKVEHTSWSTKNKGCNRNGFGNYLASFSWSRDTSKITLGKIQLCDGQVHGNDVNDIGWSVVAFAALLLKFCPFFVSPVSIIILATLPRTVNLRQSELARSNKHIIINVLSLWMTKKTSLCPFF